MKAIVIFAHPDVDNSSIGNKIIRDELKNVEGLEVRELYKLYPDFKIDVQAEQDALRTADLIVLQFPFFWYSTPALLKEWIDVVLTYGFAFGSTGKALRGKELLLSFTIGGAAESYRPEGYNTYPIDEFIKPLEQTANLCEMTFLQDYVYTHGMANIPGLEYPREATIKLAKDHAERLLTLLKAKMANQDFKPEKPEKESPVYFIARVDTKDFDTYMQEYGLPVAGQLIGRGVEIMSAAATVDLQVKEGEWPDCWNVLFKFPSQDAFDQFWSSEAYAPFKKLRREKLSNGGHVLIMPAFNPDMLG
jgi:putative NADPH-quinone reductase/uncharacterized protein (DUF1330 family)